MKYFLSLPLFAPLIFSFYFHPNPLFSCHLYTLTTFYCVPILNMQKLEIWSYYQAMVQSPLLGSSSSISQPKKIGTSMIHLRFTPYNTPLKAKRIRNTNPLLLCYNNKWPISPTQKLSFRFILHPWWIHLKEYLSQWFVRCCLQLLIKIHILIKILILLCHASYIPPLYLRF